MRDGTGPAELARLPRAVARREGSWASVRMWAARRESSAELQLGPIGRKREGERKEAMGLKREGGFSFLFIL